MTKYSIYDMKKIIVESTEEDFINKLENYDIFEQDKFGNDIVHYLINYIKNTKNEKNINFNKIMDILLKMGLDINTKQRTGQFQRSYLQLSVQVNNKNIFDYLIEKGADVNTTDANGNNIIREAIMFYFRDQNNYEHYIKTLLEKGADINHKNNYGISSKELAEDIANDYFKDMKAYILNYGK
jgi:ankyrin repeat protein